MTVSRPSARTAFAALAAAAVLVGGANLAAEAAGQAKPVLQGKNNKAAKTTKLSSKKGPALSLKAKKGPALAVNTPDLVKNLNADLLDGKSAEVLSPTAQTYTFGTAGQSGSGTSVYFQTTTLPSGTYEFELGGILQAGVGGDNQCAMVDGTRFVASNGADTAALYVYDTVPGGGSGSPQQVSGHFIGQVVSGNRLIFGCNIATTTQILQPVQFTIRKIDGVTTIPGVSPTTLPGAVAEGLGLN